MTDSKYELIYKPPKGDLTNLADKFFVSTDPLDNKIGIGLTKGKYDIDFAIGLCKNIIKHCDDNILEAKNFGISLKHSLRKMIAFLEQEKQGR